MAKTKDLETWGRAKARKRYADGGAAGEDVSIEDKAPDRGSEVDDFINEVMRDQVKKMREG